MEKQICYYHDDSDGILSAAIVKDIYPHCELVRCQYGREPTIKPEDVKNKIVMIVDFSFEKSIMDMIHDEAEILCWCDHHKTAIDKLPDLWVSDRIDGLRQTDKSGCMLTWEWFHPNTPAPEVVVLVQDYDIWLHKELKTKPFMEAAAYYMTEPESPKWHEALFPDKYPQRDENDLGVVDCMVSFGQVLLKAKQRRIERAYDKCQINPFMGHDDVVMINCSVGTDISDIGEYVCGDKGHEISVTWAVYDDNQVVVQLRSKTIDVGEIAKQNGGGGHKFASGFQTDLNFLNNMLRGRLE